MKTLIHLISATIIFTGLYLCLVLGNELCISFEAMQSQVTEHKNFIMEIGR